MKGPGIKQYIETIEKMREEAHQQGLKYIEITSKELHAQVSADFATMPTCCQAIYKLLYIGDLILEKPKGNTGFGSHLKVRFYVDNLVNRESMFPPKKRGRPLKSEAEKLNTRKKRQKCGGSDLYRLVEEWLSSEGYAYEAQKGFIVAENEEGKRCIHMQSMKRGRKQSLPSTLNDVLKCIDAEDVQYSLAFNDNISYRKAWSEIPSTVKERLNISIILADKKGNISEI